MINRVEDLINHRALIDELHALAALPRMWADIENTATGTSDPVGWGEFRILMRVGALPPLVAYGTSYRANDLAGMMALTAWLKDAPKIVRPTAEQAESLAQVAVTLELRDLSQPFPAVLVDFRVGPFVACLCYRYSEDILITSLTSHDNRNDIVTLIRHAPGRPVEEFLLKVEDGLEDTVRDSLAAQRIAINLLQSMMTFGCTCAPLQPKQHAEDRVWAKEDSERGRRARVRVREALYRLDFPHKVVIRRPSPRAEDASPTGRTTAPHWVRGHWKRQPCGPGGKDRKNVLIAPYLTGADEYQPTQRPTVYVDGR